MALAAGAGAALFWVASMMNFLVHEVVGHGGAALVMGYPLLAFYISPIEGFAISQTPPTLPTTQEIVFRLAGPAVTIAAGLLATAAIGRGRTAAGRTFLLYLGMICLGGTLAYAVGDLALHSGGDFSAAFAALGWPSAPFAGIAFVAAFATAIVFGWKALAIIGGVWPLETYWRRVVALGVYFLPGVLLQGIYLTAVHRAMRREWAMTIAMSLAMAGVWLIVGSVVAAIGRPTRGARWPVGSPGWVLAGCVTALAALIGVFGPTGATARAAVLRTPDDDWLPQPPIVNLDVQIGVDRSIATFVFKLVPDDRTGESAVSHRLIDHLNRQTSAWGYYEAFSRRNAAPMLRVNDGRAERSTRRSIWLRGRELDGARALTLTGSSPLREATDGDVLHVSVWTVDPLDGAMRPLEWLRVSAGSGLVILEAAERRPSKMTSLSPGPAVVWTRGREDPPEAVIVRFRRSP